MAEEMRQDLTRANTILEEHVKSCGKAAEALRTQLADRESVAQEWRKGLGDRLDDQDKQMRRIFYAVIGVLLSALGYLVDHAGIFPHHP